MDKNTAKCSATHQSNDISNKKAPQVRHMSHYYCMSLYRIRQIT